MGDRSFVQASRINRQFMGILSGKINISPHLGPIYLEAIYTHADGPVGCFTKLVNSKPGFSALESAMCYDLSPKFFNSHGAAILRFLGSEDLKVFNNGHLLNDILTKIVNPVFWSEFRKAFLAGKLEQEAVLSFGWLMLQLCMRPSDDSAQYQQDPEMPSILKTLRSAKLPEATALAGKIEDVLNTSQPTFIADTHAAIAGPGGRHDNDFADFRKISIVPTPEEIQSEARPFLRPSSVLEDPASEPARVAIHLDNQFRLLREDMIHEMREEVMIATEKKKGGYRKGFKIQGFSIVDIYFGTDRSSSGWGLVCRCKTDFQQFKGLETVQERKRYLDDKRNFFKHESLACLLIGKEIVAFPTINRNEDRLAKVPLPEIILQFEDTENLQTVLYKLAKMPGIATLIQIETALFGYEPTLRALQEAKTLPLSHEILLWKETDELEEVSEQPRVVVRAVRKNPTLNLKQLLSTSTDINLDSSQVQSLVSGLTQKVSLIQGPPGTGKSFVGALIAKAIFNHTEKRILVVCYTNHALDDILTSLLDINIPQSAMLRLGFKSTPRTEPLMLHNQTRNGWARADRVLVDELKAQLVPLTREAGKSFKEYLRAASDSINFMDILDFLEIEEPLYHEAFILPESNDEMQLVGADGKAAGADYLIEKWSQGVSALQYERFLQVMLPPDSIIRTMWDLCIEARQEYLRIWKEALLRESIEAFCDNAREYNQCQKRFVRALRSDNTQIFRTKRILGCTTTAAAKYREEIQAFNPNVLLVEEAGEILESHVLTSLGPETSQMILIGDHKQLRPRVNNYNLTVEKGDGYDLNRSLFERLILKDYPHETLSQQHRMRPEISALIRHLTYPELVDAPKTRNRPDLKGVQDNIVFIHHEKPEDIPKNTLADRNDMGSTTSKQNSHEVAMVLKIVKYLAQQGYGTDKIVVLTPYLGQLYKMRSMLKEENDPILSDLDSAELIRAGLMSPVEAKLKKNPIRLSTIDNYQGEESDIVIISLTRSNSEGDIGFMFSSERLNVLLSRARNALIMLGNANTFKNARKGKELWQDLFDLLGHGKHIYQGFPVKCQRHSDTVAILKSTNDFETFCPDGGCALPCGAQLTCGHACPSKCHAVANHSSMKCNERLSSQCPNQHLQTWKCHQGTPKICNKCEREKKLAKEKQQKDLEDKARKAAEEKAHLDRIDALNAQIEQERRAEEGARLATERSNAIKQKEADLAAMRKPKTKLSPVSSPIPAPSQPLPSLKPIQQRSAQGSTSQPASSTPVINPLPTNPTPPEGTDSSSFLGKVRDSVSAAIHSVAAPFTSAVPSSQNPPENPLRAASEKPFKPLEKSPSKIEWQRLKSIDGANDTAIDAIMDLTGLEAIKDQVLKIKAKIDTSLRQKVSIKQDRFNVVFLGNPGTGKTTIARHYAKFLANVKAVPGDVFVETTGARLAQEGVDEAKKRIEATVAAGGGAIFIDEAYQLTNGNNFGGPAVLDFLLAEMENNVGKLVFILAGYNKEMEKFFEHNPGLKSRVPYQFKFEDYKDEELMDMFSSMIKNFYRGKMVLQDGTQGLYSRIAIRRLGRRRGQPGFGNARDLAQVFSRIRERQAARLTKVRKEGGYADDYFLTREDIIGPNPTTAILQSNSWRKLQTLIGLKAVKESVGGLFNLIEENYQRELQEKEPMEMSLNRVFLGSPGTGKTTVAKLYGQILADLGLLTNGEVVVKNPADFVGSVVGASEANTKAILASTVGKVLIIDEAYMLYGGGGKDGSSGGSSNEYKTSVIDTIVAEVQNVPGEDRCVLMLGYKDQMIEMFQNVNPGLSRRFKIEDAFDFEDFTDPELRQILDLKLKDSDLDATDAAKVVALDLLARMRNRPNFGNAGEVENIITQAKARCVQRRARLPSSQKSVDIVFEPQDFDPEFNRGANASANLVKLFDDVVGCGDMIARLKNYQDIALSCKMRGLDPRDIIPMNFVFTGPPGTGKTTVARKMGQVFYDMAILSSGEVVECSASDLVGQYVGQTGLKTKKLFEKALGKVLFVDEAYRLSEGHFAQEAIDELVGLLTQPSFKGKLIVILAGYERDINRLLSVNQGLSSRFPEQIVFQNMDADHCLDILRKELRKNRVTLDHFEDKTSPICVEMKAIIQSLSELPDWGNARDMITLSKELVGRSLLLLQDLPDGADPNLPPSDALDVIKRMLQDRQKRTTVVPPPKIRNLVDLPMQSDMAMPPPPPPVVTSTKASTAGPAQSPQLPAKKTQNQTQDKPGHRRGQSNSQGANTTADSRDPGVSDATWAQLAAAKRAMIQAAQKAKQAQREIERKIAKQKQLEAAERKRLKELQQALAAEREAEKRAELQRQQEEARRKEQAARAARERALAELRAKQEAERRRQQEEERIQQRLRQIGNCVAGFQWINMGSYYRCAGGSHTVPIDAL